MERKVGEIFQDGGKTYQTVLRKKKTVVKAVLLILILMHVLNLEMVLLVIVIFYLEKTRKVLYSKK